VEVRKRAYVPSRRRRRCDTRFTEEEFAVIETAAARAGLTPTGYVAEAALAVARGTAPPSTSPLRELVVELAQLRTQVRRVGTNLNQAVAALNATGEAPVWLPEAAALCVRAVERVDAVSSAIGRRLRVGRP
jgi:hypothetical protein